MNGRVLCGSVIYVSKGNTAAFRKNGIKLHNNDPFNFMCVPSRGILLPLAVLVALRQEGLDERVAQGSIRVDAALWFQHHHLLKQVRQHGHLRSAGVIANNNQ